jgi:hypothetical protein
MQNNIRVKDLIVYRAEGMRAGVFSVGRVFRAELRSISIKGFCDGVTLPAERSRDAAIEWAREYRTAAQRVWFCAGKTPLDGHVEVTVA